MSDVDSRTKIAQLLAGSPAQFDSQGLQQPTIDPIMMASMAGGPAIAKVLAGMADAAPQVLASQAGAIFPEGMGVQLPQDKSLLKELGSILPESQQNYVRNQMLSDWHASNLDFPAVLRDKWALLKNAAGNY